MADTYNDGEVVPELAELGLEDKPDGPGAAVMLAAGIGICVLGLNTVFAVISAGYNDFLGKFAGDAGVGPLAGKTIIAVLFFFLSWIILHVMWKDKDVDIKKMFWVGLGLGLIGALGTFPPVFEAFHG